MTRVIVAMLAGTVFAVYDDYEQFKEEIEDNPDYVKEQFRLKDCYVHGT